MPKPPDTCWPCKVECLFRNREVGSGRGAAADFWPELSYRTRRSCKHTSNNNNNNMASNYSKLKHSRESRCVYAMLRIKTYKRALFMSKQACNLTTPLQPGWGSMRHVCVEYLLIICVSMWRQACKLLRHSRSVILSLSFLSLSLSLPFSPSASVFVIAVKCLMCS